MDFDSADQIEICFSHSKDEAAYKMDDGGAALLHYSDAELSASRVNLKERRLLARSCARLDADRSYRLRCLQTDLRLAELRQTRLATRSARVRSHLTPGERDAFGRLDAAGHFALPASASAAGWYRRPRHLEPGALIGSAKRRLDAAFVDVSRRSQHQQQRRQQQRQQGQRPATVGVQFCARSPPACASTSLSSSRDDDCGSDSSTTSTTSSSASTTASLRQMRRAAKERRRPLTVTSTATAANNNKDQQQQQQHNANLRLASRSCHAIFYTGDSRQTDSTAQQQPGQQQPNYYRHHHQQHQLDRRRLAEVERQKLTSLDRPVREFLRSLADMRV